MPELLTHVLLAYAIATLAMLKFKNIGRKERAFFVMGTIIPDLTKAGYIFNLLRINLWDYLSVFETLLGVFISCVFLATFSEEKQKATMLLFSGAIMHIFLDLLIMHASPTTPLFFPFYMKSFELGIIRADTFALTIFAILAAVFSEIIFKVRHINKKQKEVNL